MVEAQHRRRPLLSALVLLVLLFAVVPSAKAQPTVDVDWFGWGVKVDFPNNTWKVRYITYLGSDSPTPQVVAQRVVDISSRCATGGSGSLSYPTNDSAFFDGSVYIRCSLPSFRGELGRLGYTPPSGDQPFCPCVLGGGPLWVDGQFKQLPSSGTMPFLDATDRGVRSSLVINNGTARTRLEVKQVQPPGGFLRYTSPGWPIGPGSDRTLVGLNGDAIVAVADRFNWLNYLTDPGWRSFFQNNVSGNTVGYWHETPTQSGTGALSGNYRLGMNAGTLYIGYSPSTNTYFRGEIDDGGIDPGCSGA